MYYALVLFHFLLLFFLLFFKYEPKCVKKIKCAFPVYYNLTYQALKVSQFKEEHNVYYFSGAFIPANLFIFTSLICAFKKSINISILYKIGRFIIPSTLTVQSKIISFCIIFVLVTFPKHLKFWGGLHFSFESPKISKRLMQSTYRG